MYRARNDKPSLTFFTILSVCWAAVVIYLFYNAVQLANVGAPSQEVNEWFSGTLGAIVATSLSTWMAYRSWKSMQASYQPLYESAEEVSELLSTDGNVCYVETLLAFNEEQLRENFTEHLVQLAYSCKVYTLDEELDLQGTLTPAAMFVEDYDVIKNSGWAEPRDVYFALAQKQIDEIDADEAAYGEGALDEDEVAANVTLLPAQASSQDPGAVS
jgi:hypothetical protein